MSATPISGFDPIVKANLVPNLDFLSIVDVSDVTASVNSTNKRVTIQDLVESVTDPIELDLSLAIAALQSGKADTAHTHTIADITDAAST